MKGQAKPERFLTLALIGLTLPSMAPAVLPGSPTTIASNDDSGGLQSRVSFDVTPETEYYILPWMVS